MSDQSELRPETLSATGAGMTRLRTKGGASKESLYELTNGYVTASRAPTQRPGTTWKFNFADTGHTVNAGKTKGLVAFKGVLYAFTHDPTFAISGSTSYVILVLRHPTSSTATISQIHFAQPFMGFMYVVAQFSVTSDFPLGFIGHYWLQTPPTWVAAAEHNANDFVQPVAPNGFYYKAIQTVNPPAWQANLRHVTGPVTGDVIQPTVYTGFQYKAVTGTTIDASNPISGAIEPVWPKVTGAQITEFSGNVQVAPAPIPPTVPGPTPNDKGTGGRYTNPGGSGARNVTRILTN